VAVGKYTQDVGSLGTIVLQKQAKGESQPAIS